MLRVENVTKMYKDLAANNNVCFTLKDNQITVLLGENGAGKSTIIKSIVGFLKYDGSITLDGKDIQDLDVKRQIGYVPEVPELYGELTLWQQLQFVAYAYGIKDFEERANYYLNLFRISEKKDELCGALSKGMRQKVSVISALILKPRILILDEPMIGLDPEAIRDLKLVLESLKNECMILVSTHLIESVTSIWDQVIIMNHGNVVFNTTKEEFEGSNETLEEIYFQKKGV